MKEGMNPIRTKKEFLAALFKMPYKWYLDSEGMLRAGRGRYLYCPVTAVARHLTGEYYGSHQVEAAAYAIGLSGKKAWDIADAADGRSLFFRQRLLRAVGVRERKS